MTQKERKKEENSERLEAKSVYSVIQREGDKEMSRPASSLWWSGLVAGIAISSALLVEGILRASLPESDVRPLIESFGYPVGFLIVILGRLQLFTENTITPVLTLMADFRKSTLSSIAKLWAIVLVANLAGTFLAAIFTDVLAVVPLDYIEAMREVSREAVLDKPVVDVFLAGIPAGFYIAALVWMLPSSKGFEIWVIVIMTYLIAIGHFAHVIVGSAEVFLLLVGGEVGVAGAFIGYLVPALLGNVIGGTALFSLLAYAQVREEIKGED